MVDNDTLKEAMKAAVKSNLLFVDSARDYGFGKGPKLIGKCCPDEIKISSKVLPLESKEIKFMDDKWEELYKAAKQVLKPRDISKIIEAGGVAAAIESISGKIYVGVCVDTACTLGVCAERNAIFHMITNGEDSIKRVIAIDREGKAIPPCGACREFMTQLMPEDYKDIEIMMDYEKEKIMTLGELTPEWWI